MICGRCIRRSAALRAHRQQFAVSRLRLEHTSAISQTDSLQSPSTFSSATKSSASHSPPTKSTKSVLPVSSAPAGTILKGLNYLKGRDDPVALPEDQYPEWLWRCLDVRIKGEGEEVKNEGDEFSKSKRVRQKAARQQRKLEAKLLASGDLGALAPKIPITQQSIDLPANEEGTVAGAIDAERNREELRAAMRRERRSAIKEANYLKGM